MNKATGRLVSGRRGPTWLAIGVFALMSATAFVGCDPDTLVAVWHMDETSGSVMHDSVDSHDGTLRNIGLGQPGKFGTAYSFTGSSKVTVPSSTAFNTGSKNFTVSIWLKSTRTPSKADWDLIRRGTADTSGGQFKMEYYPDGTTSCGFKGDNGSESIHDGPALDDNQWHQVQCVKTSSSIKLIVDGQTFTDSASIGAITNEQPVIIGSHGGSEFYEGLLDEASISIG